MKHRLLMAAGLGLVLSLTGQMTAHGQARWEQPVGATIADRSSPEYTFTSFKLASADAERTYWVQVAIPARPAPEDGYPAIYMVDGNAAMATLTEDVLKALDVMSPPVIVAVGYDTGHRFDVLARAYDYTPPVTRDGKKIDPIVRGRPGGGAEDFTNLIHNQVKAEVRKLAPIDTSRQTLWGHSYGGIFTLYTLSAHPDYYQNYVAGDPSMWWHDGALVPALMGIPEGSLEGKKVRILVGGGRRARAAATTPTTSSTPPAPQPDRLPDTTVGTASPPDVSRNVAIHLGDAGADIIYSEFPRLHHGEMLKASLIPALKLAAEP